MANENQRHNTRLLAGAFPSVVAACGLFLGSQALAQDNNAAPSAQDMSKCRAEHDQSKTKDQADKSQMKDEKTLTGNLADCNGVLQPPATGDKELVEPAPKTGNMPVIKPGEVNPKTGTDG